MKQQAQEKRTISVRVTRETWEKTAALAEQNCYTLSGYVRHLLRVHIREQEKRPPRL